MTEVSCENLAADANLEEFVPLCQAARFATAWTQVAFGMTVSNYCLVPEYGFAYGLVQLARVRLIGLQICSPHSARGHLVQ